MTGEIMSQQEKGIRTLPLLPLKNSVLFPGLLMPLLVGRASSMAAVEKALQTEEKEIVVVTQRDLSVDVPKAADLFTIANLATIAKGSGPKNKVEVWFY